MRRNVSRSAGLCGTSHACSDSLRPAPGTAPAPRRQKQSRHDWFRSRRRGPHSLSTRAACVPTLRPPQKQTNPTPPQRDCALSKRQKVPNFPETTPREPREELWEGGGRPRLGGVRTPGVVWGWGRGLGAGTQPRGSDCLKYILYFFFLFFFFPNLVGFFFCFIF